MEVARYRYIVTVRATSRCRPICTTPATTTRGVFREDDGLLRATHPTGQTLPKLGLVPTLAESTVKPEDYIAVHSLRHKQTIEKHKRRSFGKLRRNKRHVFFAHITSQLCPRLLIREIDQIILRNRLLPAKQVARMSEAKSGGRSFGTTTAPHIAALMRATRYIAVRSRIHAIASISHITPPPR